MFWPLLTDLLGTIHDFKKTLLSILEPLVQYGHHLPHHFHDHVVIQCAVLTQKCQLSHLCKMNETDMRSIMSHTYSCGSRLQMRTFNIWLFMFWLYGKELPLAGVANELWNFLKILLGIEHYRLRVIKSNWSKHCFEKRHPVNCRSQCLMGKQKHTHAHRLAITAHKI